MEWTTLPSKRADSPLTKAFGIELQRQRKALGMSQRVLAEKAGTTQALIAHIEAGSANPTLRTLEAIGVGLRVEIRFGIGHRTTLLPSKVLADAQKKEKKPTAE